MAYGICRIQKLKAGNLKPSAQHTGRKRFTPNANPEKEHICIIGEETQELDSLVRNRIGKQPIRKNAVLAVEILLSASPEYFRPDDKSEAGYYEPSRLVDFQAAACQWLSKTYGDRIVLAHLHLDEATPHIHAYLVPLDSRGKLNCRKLFGTRSKLSQLQDSFA
ncbi:MAG: plasmid recombination protein [Iphinoe sp. HA4291-MV1]|nr:plasmid recombination protein [Iphinoe sp. HA4291-MV1]